MGLKRPGGNSCSGLHVPHFIQPVTLLLKVAVGVLDTVDASVPEFRGAVQAEIGGELR